MATAIMGAVGCLESLMKKRKRRQVIPPLILIGGDHRVDMTTTGSGRIQVAARPRSRSDCTHRRRVRYHIRPDSVIRRNDLIVLKPRRLPGIKIRSSGR